MVHQMLKIKGLFIIIMKNSLFKIIFYNLMLYFRSFVISGVENILNKTKSE